MHQVGYGVTRNDTPAGIWPVPHSVCVAYIARNRKYDEEATPPKTNRYDIVAVYAGEKTGRVTPDGSLEPTEPTKRTG